MRLRLRSSRYTFNAIYFSANAESASIAQGEMVDIAFTPQVNEFRGERSVQMNVTDIRPSFNAECSWEYERYRALKTETITSAQAEVLLPDRSTLGIIWRYLSNFCTNGLQETPLCLCRKIVRWSGMPLSLEKLLTCLDVFSDVGLIDLKHHHKHISICLVPRQEKADLNQSRTMQHLLAVKES